jgi:D-alanine-D-alanine ligase
LLKEYRQPVLVETFLPGREFTVGITGTGSEAEVLGSMEIHLLAKAEAEVYSYNNKALYTDRVRYTLSQPKTDMVAKQVEELAISAWRVLNCRDAGRVDVRCDAAGTPSFIEVNPLPGMNPIDSDLPMICGFVGISFVELIDRIVQSARRRIGK